MRDGAQLLELVHHARGGSGRAAAELRRFIERHRVGEVLTATRAAEYCGLAVGTLYNLTSRRCGPFAHKHGRKTVYYPVDLDVFLLSRVRPARDTAAPPIPDAPSEMAR